MRISDWSSDVCSSDLREHRGAELTRQRRAVGQLLVALDLRALHADRRLAVDPLAAIERLAELRNLRGVEDGGNVQQHGCLRVRQKQNGRASCRERVCQYVWISVGAVHVNKKKKKKNN